MALYPNIGAMGNYKLKAPFQSTLLENVAYTCIAIRRFADMRKLGVDPFEQLYKPNGLNQVVFQQDEANGAAVITLSDASGQNFYIPSTYILEFPSLGGYPYSVMGLSVVIGSLYNQYDMTPVINAVKDAVRTFTGITPTSITPIVLSQTTYIDSEAHDAINLNRLQSIEVSNTPSAELTRLREQNAILTDRVRELEAYIVSQQ